MFHDNNNGDERSFGVFELLSLVPSVVSGAFSVGGALIQSSAAKSIAKQQAETQMTVAQMQTEIQKRWQELELQKIQATTTAAAKTPTVAPEVQPLIASIIPSSIFGVPTIYLALGAGLLYFILKR